MFTEPHLHGELRHSALCLFQFHTVAEVHASPATYPQRAARHGCRRPLLCVIQMDMAPNDALMNTQMATNSLGLVATGTPPPPHRQLHKLRNDITQSFKFTGVLEA
jgi:hypothetical protein